MIRLLMLVALVASIAVIATSAADYGRETQRTEQVRIEWTERTKQTRIEWDARTDIAQIQADATRDTSAVYNTFGLLRCLLAAAGLVVVLCGLVVVVGVFSKGAAQ